jgi:DNA repair exonuclease SbcCD nuclease subunit
MPKKIQSTNHLKLQTDILPAMFTADWHYGHDRERKIFEKTQNDQIEDASSQLVDYAIDHGIRRIFILGDVFDKKRPLPEDELRFAKFLNRCILNQIHVHAFDGNHEANEFGATIFDTLCETYANSEYIHIYKKPFGFLDEKGLVLYYIVPHIHAKNCNELQLSPADYLRDALEKIENEIQLSGGKPIRRYLLGHFENEKAIPGAEKLLLANTANTLGSASFAEIRKTFKIDAVVSGHIHKPQIIDDFFYYTGSLICNDISEAEDQKGFIELNEKAQFKFRPLRVQKWKRVFFDLDVQRRKSPFTIEELKQKGLKQIAKDIDGCFAHVVIRYRAESRQLIDFDEIADYLHDNADTEFEIRHEVVNDKATVQARAALTTMTPKQALQAWFDMRFDGDKDNEDIAQSTRELGITIMERNI